MNFYGKSNSAFMIENFNQKPPQWTPGKNLNNKMPIDPTLDWGQNKRKMQLNMMSRDNPFTNDSYSSSHNINVILS
jgi:hypothetical protein